MNELAASFNFIARSGVGVEVTSPDPDAVEVWISLNDVAYEPPPLPSRDTTRWDRDELDALNSDVGESYFQVEAVAAFVAAAAGGLLNTAKVIGVLERGILTDQYKTGPMESVVIFDPDQGLRKVGRDAIHTGSLVRDDDQPFPVLGWMDLWWRSTSDDGTAGSRR